MQRRAFALIMFLCVFKEARGLLTDYFHPGWISGLHFNKHFLSSFVWGWVLVLIAFTYVISRNPCYNIIKSTVDP